MHFDRRTILGLVGVVPLAGAAAVLSGNKLQDEIDRAAACGGGVIKLAPREYIGNIVLRDRVTLIGGSGTIIRPAGNGVAVDLAGHGARLENVRIDATGEGGAPLASHAVRVRGAGCETVRCEAEGARFDSLYVRMGGIGYLDRESRWGPSARNTTSIVRGQEIFFQGTTFQDSHGLYDAHHGYRGLYLVDIEPNAGQRVHNVTFESCVFERRMPNPNSSIVIAYGHGRPGPDGRANVAFTDCVLRGRGISIRVKDKLIGLVRGLSVRGVKAPGYLFANAPEDQTRLEDSTISDVQLGAKRISWELDLGRSVSVDNVSTSSME